MLCVCIPQSIAQIDFYDDEFVMKKSGGYALLDSVFQFEGYSIRFKARAGLSVKLHQ